MMKRFLVIVVLCMAVVIAFLSGCKQESDVNKHGEIVLGAARDLAPGEKDAFFCSAILKVWEPLIGTDEKGEPSPVLAKSWESVNSGRTWIFHLRQGVKFHDGSAFNAYSVIANFDRMKTMGFRGSQFYNMSLPLMYPNIVSWTALDEYTVSLSFSIPMPTLPYMMTGWNSAQFNPNSFDSTTGDFTNLNFGTGPFILQEVIHDQYLILKRNENYWGNPAKAPVIRIKTIPSGETRFSALKVEEIMGVLDLGGITPVLAQELIKEDRFELHTSKSTISHYLAINGEKHCLGDRRLRRAISLAIDRQALVDNYFYGNATVTENLINSVSPFSRVLAPDYNPDEAKKLAKEVLGEKRLSVKMILSQGSMEKYPYKEMGEWIQAELKPLGIDVELVMLEGATASQAIRNGEYDLTLHIRGLNSMEPESLFWEWLSSDERGKANKNRHLGFRDITTQMLLESISQTTTIDERRAIYDQLQSSAHENYVGIPLLEDKNLIVHNKKIVDFEPEFYGVSIEKTTWKDQ